MKYLLLISISFLVACGSNPTPKPNDPRTISGVDPTFKPYVDLYLQYKGKPLHTDIPIQFTDLDGTKVGVCTRWSTGQRQIQIDRFYWDYLTNGQKIGTISHEFGHCDLNRDHMPHQYPAISIMDPFVFDILSNLNYYMDELFTITDVTPSFSHVHQEHDCVHDIKVE